MNSIIKSLTFSLGKVLDVCQSLTAFNNMQGASEDIILTPLLNVCIFWSIYLRNMRRNHEIVYNIVCKCDPNYDVISVCWHDVKVLLI